MTRVPDIRIQEVNQRPVNEKGRFVLYWMIANRRVRWNFALQRAVEWAVDLGKPLLVFEALRNGYQWSSDRLHRFIIDGMADNADELADTDVSYYPYVEMEKNAGKGMLRALSEHAAVVVTDEFPCFMLPRMVAAAAKQVGVRMETVDANGLLPLRATDGRVFPTAFAFRRFLQKNLPDHIASTPKRSPLSRIELPGRASVPRDISSRWPRASRALLDGSGSELASIPIDHSVPPVEYRGGPGEAAKVLKRFLGKKLSRYNSGRTDLDERATSGLSPYLHFGHISAHEVFSRIAAKEEWTPERLPLKADGKRSGWWRMSDNAEAFLDQLVTWREVGYNMTFHREDHGSYESLPQWAQDTLLEHERDPRPYVYSLSEFEQARTHDELWNAAQRELLRDGGIHNYMRMLWGKKILEWSESPREALEIMIELNNKYAVDGRNPNSYSGIFWVLGRYDRPWGPERPIFGKIRYMSSENTARKIKVDRYLTKHEQGDLFE